MDFGIIRSITLFDLDKIIELEKKCFNKFIAYTPKQLKYLITRAHSLSLAEISHEVLRGFIIVLYKNGSRVAVIETLNVDPMFQGNGIGKKLLLAAEKEMNSRGIKSIRLEVSIGNNSAIKLYEKSGFSKIAILRNYYMNNQFGSRDAFKMVKELITQN